MKDFAREIALTSARYAAHGVRIIKRSGIGPFRRSERSTPATFLLRDEYQDPYLERMAALLQDVQPQRPVRFLNLRDRRGTLARWRMMLKDQGVIFHAHPFATDKFPATSAHIRISHGLDMGRYDEGGSFSYGPLRLLGKDRKRLYSAILSSSPWGVEIGLESVPEYSDRFFVTGDQRADEIRSLGQQQGVVREKLGISGNTRVVGLYTSHGEHSAFRWLGDSLLELSTALATSVQVILFFHPFERKNEPELYEKTAKLAHESNRRIRIAEHSEFELCLAACDLLIGDYSSTSLYFSLLRRPLACTPLNAIPLLSNSPGDVLRKSVVMVRNNRDIVNLVRRLAKESSWRGLPILPDSFLTKLYPKELSFSKAAPKALTAALTLAHHKP